MNRCHKTWARRAGAVFCVALAGFSMSLPATAFAQGIIRSVPADVKLGKMTVTQPPDIVLNGQVDRLSPGSRIRDLNNMMVLSGGIQNQELPVVYKRDSAGLVHEVWILTPAEYAKLGGVKQNNAEGVAQFLELLALIFGARR